MPVLFRVFRPTGRRNIILNVIHSILASGNVLYVSKARGYDGNNTCKNITTPCKTLNHVMNMSGGDDVIKLDASNTAAVPYSECPTTTKSINGKLSFYSWNGTATINCSANALNFTDNSPNQTTAVEFHHLKFFDTFLEIEDVSLVVSNCSLGSFQKGTKFANLISVSIFTAQVNLRININSTIFLENNNAGSLSVVNNQGIPVYVELSNITVSKNYLEKAKHVMFIRGNVNFNLVNSEISNTEVLGIIRTALVDFSNCFPAETESSSTVITFSLRETNFSSNNAAIVFTTFCTAANVSISKTTSFNNTGAQSGPPSNFYIVFVRSNAKNLRVVLNNISFLNNKIAQYIDGFTVGVSAVSENTTTLFVSQCIFSYNKGGGIFFILDENSRGTSHTGLVDSNCAAHSCNNTGLKSTKKGHGLRDQPLQYQETFTSDFVIGDCEFHNNTGNDSPTIIVEGLSIYLRIKRCVFVDNFAKNGGAIFLLGEIECKISDSTFYYNTGQYGSGAIRILWGTVVMKNCTLDSNSGGKTELGQAIGTVDLSGNGSVFIQDSRIIQRNTTRTVSKHGTFYSTLGISSDVFNNVTLSNYTLEYTWSPSLEKVIVIQLSHTKNFVLEEGASIECPSGYTIKKSKKIGVKPSDKLAVQNIECELCATGSYTIDRGVYR